MARLINRTQDGYTVIPNKVFLDKRLSMKGLGLLCKLLSLPDGWEYSEQGMAATFTDGRASVRTAIAELETLGYLRRTQGRMEGGKFSGGDWVVDIGESPQEPPQSVVDVPKEEPEPEEIPYEEIIDHLNDKAGTHYRHGIAKTKALIRARWIEGFRLPDFQKVIDSKVGEWRTDSKYRKYIRPETLFGTKFEGYLQGSEDAGGEGDVFEQYR